MHWLNFFLQTQPSNPATLLPPWLQWTVAVAPVLVLLTAASNLVLAFFVFRFTKQKNENDVKIKWFTELIYTPNKEVISKYFSALSDLKKHIPSGRNLTEQERIDLINIIKDQRQIILLSFVDPIKAVSTPMHQILEKEIEALTDSLTMVLDNDELKLDNEKTYRREIVNRVIATRNQLIKTIFSYKG